jgi:putative transport protein
MDAIRVLLETQPLFTLFLTVALGYIAGEISFKGFSLGAGAVLFVGLAIGGFAPKAAPPALLGTLGLLLFLYGVGIQYGVQFFRGLISANGLKANAAAALGVIGSGWLSLALVPLFNVKLDESLGLFAGSVTSMSTLQAVIATLQSGGAAVGYSIACPFSVAYLIICIYALKAWLKPKTEQPAAQAIETAEIAVNNPEFIGLSFTEFATRLPSGVAVAAINRQQHNRLPSKNLILQADDVSLATRTDLSALERAAGLIGELQPERITSHREDLDSLRVSASSKAVAGQALGELTFPEGVTCSIAQLRRGDADLLPSPELILKAADRVGLLVNRAHVKIMRKFFGDAIKGTAALSFISLGIGAALGLLLGMIPLPIPGVSYMTLRFAVLLLLALYLGKLRRSGPFVWAMPLSANIVLRNFFCDHWRYRHHLPALRRRYRAGAGADHCRMLPLAFPAAVRHDGSGGCWCDWQFCHSSLCQPGRSDRAAGCRLRDDLSVHDRRKYSFCPDRCASARQIGRLGVEIVGQD